VWSSEVYTAEIAGLQINLVRDAEQHLKEYAAERRSLIAMDRAMPEASAGEAPLHSDTTYFTVADQDGMGDVCSRMSVAGMPSNPPLQTDGASPRR